MAAFERRARERRDRCTRSRLTHAINLSCCCQLSRQSQGCRSSISWCRVCFGETTAAAHKWRHSIQLQAVDSDFVHTDEWELTRYFASLAVATLAHCVRWGHAQHSRALSFWRMRSCHGSSKLRRQNAQAKPRPSVCWVPPDWVFRWSVAHLHRRCRLPISRKPTRACPIIASFWAKRKWPTSASLRSTSSTGKMLAAAACSSPAAVAVAAAMVAAAATVVAAAAMVVAASMVAADAGVAPAAEAAAGSVAAGSGSLAASVALAAPAAACPGAFAACARSRDPAGGW
jgi:hypothetical protein